MPFPRKSLLLSFLPFLLIGAVYDAAHPNIVFILADDLGYAEVGATREARYLGRVKRNAGLCPVSFGGPVQDDIGECVSARP